MVCLEGGDVLAVDVALAQIEVARFTVVLETVLACVGRGHTFALETRLSRLCARPSRTDEPVAEHHDSYAGRETRDDPCDKHCRGGRGQHLTERVDVDREVVL